MAAKRRVFVVGVGMTKFEKPGGRDWDYPDMAKEAVTKALTDAAVPYTAIEQVCVGYCFGDSTCGQRAIYQVGLTGVPVYNVNNNCATGSTALFMARQFVQGGVSECVLALGFEKMEKGSLGQKYNDRTSPMDKHGMIMLETHGYAKAPPAPQMFGNAGREHMQKYGTKPEHFAKIAEKNHRHSVNNPYSQFQDVYTLEQILKSPKVHEPLTKLQCCPTSDGAAAAILCSEEFVFKWGLQDRAIEVAGMAMATDLPSTFSEKTMMKVVGYDMTKTAAHKALAEAKMSINDVQVVELHDCFSANELITYEALGLCGEGQAGAFIDRGDNTYGGKYVVNPSGGLISKGHPLGATGLAQCAELCWQLRGQADKRQVKDCKGALQHNLGLGGAAVVAVYRKPVFTASPKVQAISNREALLKQKIPNSDEPDVPAPRALAASAASSSQFGAAQVFETLQQGLQTHGATLVKQVGAVMQFNLSKPDAKATWTVDLKNGAGAIKEGAPAGKADCVFTMSDADFLALTTGKANAQNLFMQGKLKLSGNMAVAMKFGKVIESLPKPAKL